MLYYPNRDHVRPFVAQLGCGIPTYNIKIQVALCVFDLIRQVLASFVYNKIMFQSLMPPKVWTIPCPGSFITFPNPFHALRHELAALHYQHRLNCSFISIF